MAIKGKRRTKSKPVARGPRAMPVEVKPPFLQRRWLQVGSAFAAGALLALAVVWAWSGIRGERAEAREDEQRRTRAAAIQQYKAVLEQALAPLGRPLPPADFNLLPDLRQRLERLAEGRGGKATIEVAEASERGIRRATEALGELDLVALVRDKGFSVEVINYALSSRDRMVQGLRLYEELAGAVREAASAEGKERTRLVELAKRIEPTALEIFGDGYSDYVQVLGSVGLFEPPLALPGVTEEGS